MPKRNPQVGRYLGYGRPPKNMPEKPIGIKPVMPKVYGSGKRLTRIPGTYDHGRPMYGAGKKLTQLPQYGGGICAGPHMLRPAKRLTVLPGQAVCGH